MNACLLTIDVQCGFINDSTEHIPKRVEALQNEYQYIYVTRFFNKKDSLYRKLIKWDRFDRHSDDFHLAFRPLARATIFDKSIYSCVNKSFLEALNENHIGEVDICGIDTDICVTKCAVDLFEAGITPRVLGPYCASHAGVDAHRFALMTLERFIGSEQVIK